MLLGNYSVLNRNPLRFLGGGTATPEVNFRSNFGRGGCRKNRQYVGGSASANKQFSLPYGCYPPYASLLPQVGGDICARRSGDFSMGASATGGLGMPGDGAATITIETNAPDGQLIVSGSGSGSFVIDTNSPLLTASIGGTGAASFVLSTNMPILGAEASLTASVSFSVTSGGSILPTDDSSKVRTGSASFSFSGSLAPYAIGIMQGTTEVSSGAPTAEQNASAVWGRLLGGAISAEDAMLAAGSAGDPWSAVIDGELARVILSNIQKVLRNRTVTNPTTGKMTVYDDDGTTVLFECDLFQDVDGATPYQGKGAERRERLE